MYIDVQYTQLNSSLSIWKPSLDLTNSAHVTLDFTNVRADHSLQTLRDSQIKGMRLGRAS